MRGRSQWLSAGQPMHFTMCQAYSDVLQSESEYEGLSKRAIELLESIREEFTWLAEDETTLVVDADNNVTWWTFAGKLFNAAMADSLAGEADKVVTDNFCISFSRVVDIDNFKKIIFEVFDDEIESICVHLEENFIQELKFSECLSQENIDRELFERYDVAFEISKIKNKKINVVNSKYD